MKNLLDDLNSMRKDWLFAPCSGIEKLGLPKV